MGPRSISSARQYEEDRTYPIIALVGLMMVMASLAVGAVIGLYHGDLWAQSAEARAGDNVRQGVTAAAAAWNPMVLFFGISLLMAAVAVVLRRIIKTIRGELGASMTSSLPVLLTAGEKGKGE